MPKGKPNVLRIENLKDVQPGTSLRAMIYGAPGVGKTTLGASFPAPLFVDWDDGMEALKGSDFDRLRPADWADWERQLDALIREQGLAYETIVLDTITMAQRALNDLVKGSKETMEMRDWGVSLERMASCVRKTMSLPWHVLILAHAKEKEGEGGGIEIVPELSGQAQGFVRALCSTIGYMTIEPTSTVDEKTSKRIPGPPNRWITFESDGRFVAKNRFVGINAVRLSAAELAEVVACLPTKADRTPKPKDDNEDGKEEPSNEGGPNGSFKLQLSE